MPTRNRAGAWTCILALAVSLCWTGESLAAWRQTRFLIGGWGVNNAPNDPVRLVRLEAAGIDFLQNHNHQIDLSLGQKLKHQVDSLRIARRGFRMQVVLHDGFPRERRGRFSANDAVGRNWQDIRRSLDRTRGGRGSSLLGFFVWDEPTTRDEMSQLGEFARRLARDPRLADQVPFVNLLPLSEVGGRSGYETEFGQGVDRRAAYVAYLDAYLSQFDDLPQPAPFLSFDHYPFQVDGREGSAYFENLGLARDRAAAFSRPGARIPLWVIIQLASLKPPGRDPMRAPSLSQVRWQAWTAVAYGAKSISYWTVGTDPSPGTGYRGGVLEVDGSPSPKYQAIRDLNLELHALGPTLMRLDPVSVFHVAAGGQRGIEDELLADPRRVYGIVDRVSGDGAIDCMVGYFKEQGTGVDYLLVVNKNLDKSRDFQLELGSVPGAVFRLDPKRGNAIRLPVTGRTLKVPAVPPASARLYRVEGPVVESLLGVKAITREGTATYYGLPSGVLRVDRATGARRWVPGLRGSQATDLKATADGVRRRAAAAGR